MMLLRSALAFLVVLPAVFAEPKKSNKSGLKSAKSSKAIREAFVLEDDKTSISLAVDFFAILEFIQEMEQYNICCNSWPVNAYSDSGKEPDIASLSYTAAGDTSMKSSWAAHTPYQWMSQLGGGMMGVETGDVDCKRITDLMCPIRQVHKSRNLRGGTAVDNAAGRKYISNSSGASDISNSGEQFNYTPIPLMRDPSGLFDIGGTQIISTGSVRKFIPDKDLGNVNILDNHGHSVDMSQMMPDLEWWSANQDSLYFKDIIPASGALEGNYIDSVQAQNPVQNEVWPLPEEGYFFSDACTVIEGEIDFIHSKMFHIKKQKCDIDVCVGTNEDTGVPDCFYLRFSGERSANIDILPKREVAYAGNSHSFAGFKESLNSVTASLIGGTGRFAMAQGQALVVVKQQESAWEPRRDTIMVFIEYFGYDFGDEW